MRGSSAIRTAAWPTRSSASGTASASGLAARLARRPLVLGPQAGLPAGREQLAAVSAWLRENRERSFYRDDDFIPTERYTREDAERAMAGARLAVSVAGTVIRDG